MKICLWLLLICTSLVVVPLLHAEVQTKSIFRLAISGQTFRGFNKNDAAAALLAWTRSIVKEKSLDIRPELTIFNQFEELRKAFLSGEIDAAHLNAKEILQLEKIPDTVYLPVIDEEFYIRYAVIVHNQTGIRDPKDLHGRNLSIHDSARMVYAMQWLEMLMADSTKTATLSDTRYRPDVPTKEENASKAIFQVFFRQVDAAVVTTQAFDLACELNPQIGKDLTVLAVSQPFITSAFIFRPGCEKWIRDQLETAMVELHQTVGGRQLMIAFQCSRLEKHPVSILGPTIQFINKYSEFKHVGSIIEAKP